MRFLAPIVDPMFMLNMDATTFKIEINGEEFVWHIHEEGDTEQVQREGEMATVVYIKEMVLTNTYGNVAETVYIIQDKTMDPEDCVHYLVRDIGVSLLNATQGHIFVMKSRAANAKFNDMYFRKIIVPYIDDARYTYRLSQNLDYEEDEELDDYVEDFSDCKVLITFDGEKTQTDGFLATEVMEYCDQSNIFLVKLAASCTKIQQPLDAGKKFDSKKKAKSGKGHLHSPRT